MTQEERKALLDQQLQLLAEKSQTATAEELYKLSCSICSVFSELNKNYNY